MKKVNLILCLMAFLILSGCNYMDSREMRVRILANSNSETDQKEKIILRDALIDIFYNENIAVKEENLIRIKNLLDEQITIKNDYKVELKEVAFPAKVKNNRIVPSGTYMTLLITIGEGKGDNWWSVLYPEFFGVTYDDSDEIEYRSFIYDILKED